MTTNKEIDKIGRFRGPKKWTFRKIVQKYAIATGLPVLECARLIRDMLDKQRKR